MEIACGKKPAFAMSIAKFIMSRRGHALAEQVSAEAGDFRRKPKTISQRYFGSCRGSFVVSGVAP